MKYNKITKITTLDELMGAALLRMAVVVPSSPCFSRPLPAAFIINMQAVIVHRMIKDGMYIYGRRTKK